ncbi:MAG TPA: carboxypeptidase regulatory-like domain-containing protein [Chitinophagaceae bacterium]|nr:carboxypeptidase regulatory-like domain-containing protein [Chitinophagaceae bacterium]
MLKRLTILFFAIATGFFSFAQVTTSSLNGTVKDNNGQTLAGATVTAIHVPSGTRYSTLSSKDGVFNLQGLRVGGPYQLKIDYVGLKSATFDGITLSLGEPYNINAQLSISEQVLENVVVSTKGRKSTADKFGASTIVSNRQITTLPTISRSITDFTRLTPQANGNSFSGRDGRYNNVTIDGANLNNNFGLSTDPLPGGGANPISLDAIEEISVNIAPYDVRQAQFTGANIAAVTKSGTNTFHGTAYGYYRNQSMIGTNVAGFKLPKLQKSYNKIYGGSLGGPIIKNKLFFFVNGEYEERSAVLAYFTPAGGSGTGNLSSVPIDSMQKLADYLKSKYDYDPGPFDNFNSNVPVKNHKILGKLDWNISTSTKLTVKFSDFQNTQDFLPSGSGGINGASSTGIITYGPKFSSTAMGFGSTVYSQIDKVRSGSFDLTSNFHGKFANQFLATITKISTNKDHPGAQFPFVDIAGFTPGSKNNYLSFGNEPFNGNYNVVINDVYTATDNFSYFAGKHTLTAGVSYEFQKVGNGFMPGSQGYYANGTLDDFLNNRAPKQFALTYSLIPGQDAVISANLKVGQLGAYVQDEININENFKLTAGLRVDKPVYPDQPLPNNAVNSLGLYDHSGNITNYNTGAWPKNSMYWSPRVGFRGSIPDQKLVIRGGSGLYTGRIPFVFLTNLPTGVGPYQFGALVTTNLQNFLFNPDAHAYNPFYNTTLNPAQFPTIGGTVVPSGAYALITKNFKFPQIWRTDLAFDKQLGKGWGVTIEGLYTKDVHAVDMFNANQKVADATINLGGGVTRPSFSAAAARKLNAASGNAIVLDNTNKGEALSFTAQINKSFSKGFYGFIAYTYTAAFDVSANPGSQANSVWSINPTSLTQNALELSTSSFSVPHRVVGDISYRFEYVKHLATTISAYYEGASQGNISYIYNGDVNNDGNSADLMYIPKSPSEISFVAIPASGNVPGFTAQQQSDAFFKFIAQDKYLSKHQGQVAERNAAIQPWYSRVDMKFTQDIFTNFGGHKNSLQFTVDIQNALNLISHNWGVRQFFIVSNPLKYVNATGGQANYQLATYLPAGATSQILLDKTYIHNNSTTSTWNLQLGLRYIF